MKRKERFNRRESSSRALRLRITRRTQAAEHRVFGMTRTVLAPAAGRFPGAVC